MWVGRGGAWEYITIHYIVGSYAYIILLPGSLLGPVRIPVEAAVQRSLELIVVGVTLEGAILPVGS